MGPSDWIWYAPRILYSIGYGARQSIGVCADGSSAEYVGFTADDAERVGLTADGSEYGISFTADAPASDCRVYIAYHSNRSFSFTTASSTWSELGVS